MSFPTDHPAGVLALARSASDRFVEADTLIHLGLVQQLTGDYPAATASQQQAWRSTANPATGLARPRR